MVATTKDKEKITTETTGKRKWLGRFGNFLFMGGWILIAVVVFIIIVAIYTLANG